MPQVGDSSSRQRSRKGQVLPRMHEESSSIPTPYGSGVTHFVSYAAKNMGRTWVEAACGERIHISEFSISPTCKQIACIQDAIKHRLLLKREGRR